ncbi:hypothetical protein [Streptomyces sp. NPDC001381]|uniref:hypothetical protein n=1 Tax=Streptomyces sp. NPDC001381 TaxID=3364567 RepID=UPI0036AB9001
MPTLSCDGTIKELDLDALPGTAAELRELSPECAPASQPGYEDLHVSCRRLQDIPLPHGGALPLVRRCGCACHHPADRRRETANSGIPREPGTARPTLHAYRADRNGRRVSPTRTRVLGGGDTTGLRDSWSRLPRRCIWCSEGGGSAGR